MSKQTARKLRHFSLHTPLLAAALMSLSLTGCMASTEDDSDELGLEQFAVADEEHATGLSAQDKTQLSIITQHALDGGLTDADKAWLKAHPEIAAGIPDPSKTEFGEVVEATGTEAIFGGSSGVKASSVGAQAAVAQTTCRITNRYQKVYGNVHDHLFDYHTRVGWCYNGSRITKVNFAYAYFDNIDTWIDVKTDDSINKVITLSSSKRQTDNKGKASYCILKYGCTDTYYPHNKVTFDAQGGTSFWWDN
jgi:hypothetical protein